MSQKQEAQRLERRFYNAYELAELMGVSRDTIVRLIQEGELPGKKLGRNYFVPKDQFEEFWKQD